MITKRLVILQVALVLGLGAVFFLPTKTALGPAGITLTLPADVGDWRGRDAAVSPQELAGLAPDTGFARRYYKDDKGNEMYVSIVLSGADMANSIHRPERCLSAQGWTVERSDKVKIALPAGTPPLTVTKLQDEREMHPDATHTLAWRNLNYYWFVGSHDITASHWTRTFIDVRDRILHGEAQRWAYITVATNVSDNLRPDGLNSADTARLVEGFIAQVVPRFEKP